jgi:hypothetical protein
LVYASNVANQQPRNIIAHVTQDGINGLQIAACGEWFELNGAACAAAQEERTVQDSIVGNALIGGQPTQRHGEPGDQRRTSAPRTAYQSADSNTVSNAA